MHVDMTIGEVRDLTNSRLKYLVQEINLVHEDGDYVDLLDKICDACTSTKRAFYQSVFYDEGMGFSAIPWWEV